MKQLFLLSLFLILFLAPFKQASAQCNWKSRNIVFRHLDSCQGVNHSENSIVAYVFQTVTYPQGFPVNCSAEWTVNGVTFPSTYNGGVVFNFNHNGLYTFCIKIKDTVSQCDTTYCKDIYMNCGGSCPDWSKELVSGGAFVTESCPGKYFYGEVGLNNQKAYTYRWTCNSEIINDEDSFGSYVPDSNGLFNVCVRITDTLTKCDTMICYDLYYNCSTAGIGELPLKQKAIKVHPNPAVAELNFESRANGSVYTIYDSRGRVLLNGLSIPGMNLVDIGSLPAGIYYFSLTENHIVYHSIFVRLRQ